MERSSPTVDICGLMATVAGNVKAAFVCFTFDDCAKVPFEVTARSASKGTESFSAPTSCLIETAAFTIPIFLII